MFGILPSDDFDGMSVDEIRSHKLQSRLEEFDIEGACVINFLERVVKVSCSITENVWCFGRRGRHGA